MDYLSSDDFSALSSCKQPLHVAIGMFDGVHLGHKTVIDSAIQSARLDGGKSGVFTFHPHPSHHLKPDNPTPQIYPPEVKREMLARMQVDYYLDQRFDQHLASLEAEIFVDHLMAQFPALASLSVGENFRFGKGRKGDVRQLLQLARRRSVSVYSCERVHFDGLPISSTRLRTMLSSEPIEIINPLLGHPYTSIGVVQEGRKLGRTIGFPTLNVTWEAEIQPLYGVYAVRFSPADDPESLNWQNGIANFGVRPTVDSSTTVAPLLEIHSLQATELQYGDKVSVEWVKRIRAEKKFESLATLQSAINEDIKTVREIFTNRTDTAKR